MTSHLERASESGVLPVLVSDHYLVYGVYCWKAPKREGRSINFRCFKDIDNDDFRDDIINAPWEHVLNCHDVNDAWSICYSTFMSIINNHAPMKSKRILGSLVALARWGDTSTDVIVHTRSQNVRARNIVWDVDMFSRGCRHVDAVGINRHLMRRILIHISTFIWAELVVRKRNKYR